MAIYGTHSATYVSKKSFYNKIIMAVVAFFPWFYTNHNVVLLMSTRNIKRSQFNFQNSEEWHLITCQKPDDFFLTRRMSFLWERKRPVYYHSEYCFSRYQGVSSSAKGNSDIMHTTRNHSFKVRSSSKLTPIIMTKTYKNRNNSLQKFFLLCPVICIHPNPLRWWLPPVPPPPPPKWINDSTLHWRWIKAILGIFAYNQCTNL